MLFQKCGKQIAGLVICLFLLVPVASADSETAADALLLLLPATAYALSYSYDDEPGRLQLYKAFGSTLVTTAVLKSGLDEPRPEDGPDAGSNDSFPSAHTSLTFSSAAFIQRRYGWQWGAPAYLLSAYTGWSRVKTKHHHSRDVVAGALLGLASGYLFVSPFKQLELQVGVATVSVSMQF